MTMKMTISARPVIHHRVCENLVSLFGVHCANSRNFERSGRVPVRYKNQDWARVRMVKQKEVSPKHKRFVHVFKLSSLRKSRQMREENTQVAVVAVCRIIGCCDALVGVGCHTPVEALLEKQHWRFKDAEAISSSMSSKTEFEVTFFLKNK